MKRTTVLLAEDHTVVREGFRNLLETEADIKIIAEAKDGREAVAMAAKLCPDVVLMDIAMPELNGLDATRQILKAHPTSRVLILSAHSEDAYVANAVDSGACGYLLKQSSLQDVCEAIRTVAKGGTFFSKSVGRRIVRLRTRQSERTGKAGGSKSALTPREREVLQLIAEGKANKQTASDLGISIKTVEKHREHLMEKLDIHDTAGLTRYAMNEGVIEGSVKLTIG